MQIKFNGHTLEMYDSIQELPITRFQAYNLNLMIDAGIGSDLDAFDQRINNIRQLVQTDQKAAQTELTNLQQNVRFIMSNSNPVMNSFVAMIKGLNGKTLTDYDMTEEGMKRIIEELGRKQLPFIRVKTFLKSLKKNSTRNLNTSFQKLRIVRV